VTLKSDLKINLKGHILPMTIVTMKVKAGTNVLSTMFFQIHSL